jgi:hypothetical protein
MVHLDNPQAALLVYLELVVLDETVKDNPDEVVISEGLPDKGTAYRFALTIEQLCTALVVALGTSQHIVVDVVLTAIGFGHNMLTCCLLGVSLGAIGLITTVVTLIPKLLAQRR